MPRIQLLPNEYILQKQKDVNWGKWLEMIWNDIEWPVIATLGLLSFLLGFLGFSQYQYQYGVNSSVLDCVYSSLQLFSLQASFSGKASIPIALQIARFLSPALAVYTLFQAFMVVFKEQLELFRLVRITNHVIICGLGLKGLHLAKELRKAGYPIVIVEKDGNNPFLEQCREIGTIVVIGDARDGRILLKAGINRAKYLIAVCGEDGTNVEVTEQVKGILRGNRKKVLNCIVHITDTYLWTLLREREFEQDQPSLSRLSTFNVYDRGARILLRDTFHVSDLDQMPHVLIIGMGDLAQSLTIQAAREWCLQGAESRGKLHISVIDPDVKIRVETLQIRFPMLLELCEFHLHKYHTNWPEFQSGGFLELENQAHPITHAYVCFDDTPLSLYAGFTLLRLLPNQRIQIMVRMTEDAGLATFLREIKSLELKELSAFGLLDRTCKVELLDESIHESLARVIHENYVQIEKQKGNTPENSPSMVPWEKLGEELKESNRRQADQIGFLLAKVGLGIKPWCDYGADKYVFNVSDVETMAKAEHKRWCDEKRLDGWIYGEKRDNDRRIHPDLVDTWDDPRLDAAAKEKDRNAVRLIPLLLARAGFQVSRLRETGGGNHLF